MWTEKREMETLPNSKLFCSLVILVLVLNGFLSASPPISLTSEPSGQNDLPQSAFAQEKEAKTANPMQFQAGNHLAGFLPNKVYFAALDHALSVEFLGTAGVTPQAAPLRQTDLKPHPSLFGKRAVAREALQRVTYPNLWPGITVVYDTAANGFAKTTYQLAPGVDPAHIQLRYNLPVELQPDGSLQFIIASGQGGLTESAPVAWQDIKGQRRPVMVEFVTLPDNNVSFNTGVYDLRYPLVIDPVYAWHTFYGGTNDDYAYALAVDGSGNVYVAGWSDTTWQGDGDADPLHPRTPNGDYDIVIVKLTSAGGYQWHTFYGHGTESDKAYALAIDGDGNVYVVGESRGTWQGPGGISPLHPHTATDNTDIFILKLTDTGNYQWHTFYGRAGLDKANALAVDGSGNVYVAGSSGTWKGDGNTNPLHPQAVGGTDIFVLKLTNMGNYQWHTFYGGSSDDEALALVMDGGGNVYAAGWSHTTWQGNNNASPLHPYSGSDDIVVMKLTSAGSYQWHTFYGGISGDRANALAVDGSDNVYMAGYSTAAWQGEGNTNPLHPYSGSDDIVVMKLTSTGSYQWHTFYGGTGFDKANALAVDGSGNVYLSGYSTANWYGESNDDPLHPLTAGQDIVIMQLTSAGGCEWHTFYGGIGSDSAIALAVDGNRNVYVAGSSTVTWQGNRNTNPLHSHSSSRSDVVVMKLASSDTATPTPMTTRTNTPTQTMTPLITTTHTPTPTLTQTSTRTPTPTPTPQPSTGRLMASAAYLLTGQDVLLLASIHAANGQPVLGLNTVTVQAAGQSFSLYDDGSHGDFYNRDGLYTAFTSITSTGTIPADLFVGAVKFDGLSLTVIDDPELVVLTDWAALYAEFRDTGMAALTAQADRNQNGRHDFFDLVERLNIYASAHHGVVVDLSHAIKTSVGFTVNYMSLAYGNGTSTRYQMGTLIDQLISGLDTQTKGSIQNIALVGDDQVVPFYRVYDPTDHFGKYTKDPGYYSREKDYPALIGGIQSNAVLQDLSQGYVVSDVPYSIRTSQIITPGTWLLSYPDEEAVRPMPDLGIGRVFTSHPADLIQAIDRYEQPLPLFEGQASARVFLGDDPNIDFSVLADRGIIHQLHKWFRNHLDLYDVQKQPWVPPDFVAAFSNTNLVSLWGHATHKTVLIQNTLKIQAADLNTLSLSGPAVFIGFGCHMGLSVSNYPDGRGLTEPFANALVNPIVAQGLTFFAPSSQAYVLGSAQAFRDPNLHELMVSLFTNGLTDHTLPTVGRVWQALFPIYHRNDPALIQNSNAGVHFFHIVGAYGNVLYGLPTQPIERISSSLLPLETTTEHLALAPLALTALTPLTITVTIPDFIINQLNDGTSFFSVANGGTHLSPPNGPSLPLVIRTLKLPDNLIVTDVRLTELQGHTYPTPVTLANSSLSTNNGELITGTYTLPSSYPENIYRYAITRNANGALLTLSVVPLKYSPATHQVTLYDRLSFEIDYVVSAPAAGPQFSEVTVNAGQPVRLNRTDQTIQVKIASTESRNITLLWNVRDPAGYVIGSGHAPLGVFNGTTIVTLPLKTLGWMPGPKDLTVYLQDGENFPSSRNIPLLAEGIQLIDVTPRDQIRPPDASEAFWQLEVRDENGALVRSLASTFSATVNGQPVTILVQEWAPGVYQVRLPLSDITNKDHLVQIRAVDNRGIIGQQNWILIRENSQSILYLPLIQR
jgi:hypothetical protein